MEITYTQQGDYLLPNLTLPEQDIQRSHILIQIKYIFLCCRIHIQTMVLFQFDIKLFF